MSSAAKNLSVTERSSVPSAAGMKFGIVCSEWNYKVTGALLEGCRATLVRNGARETDISTHFVPGSFELTVGAQWLAGSGKFDAVICLGCVIQGETRHFDFICNAVANGVTEVAIKYDLPVIFGVLTPDTMQQALDRSGGLHGNKGDEAAVTAIKMVALSRELRGSHASV